MLKKVFKSQLRHNMASGIVVTTANTIVSLVGFPVYLHYLGAQIYGLWLVLAVVLHLSLIGMLGIPNAITKLVAEENSRKDIDAIMRCVTTALIMLCGAGIIVVLTIYLFRHIIVSFFKLDALHSEQVVQYIPLIAFLALYVFIVEVTNATLSGLGRIDHANYNQSAGRIATLAASIIMLAMGCGLKSMLIGNGFGYLVTHVAGLICIHKSCRINLLQIRNWDSTWAVRLLRFGGGILGMSMLGMFLSPFNKLVLARYAGLETVPVYEIAYRVAMQLRAFFEVFFRALLPEISRVSANRTAEVFNQIRDLNNRCFRLIVTFALPAYLLAAFTAAPLLKIWLGNSFVTSMPWALRLLLLGSFISLLAVPSFYTLLGMGHVRVCLYSSIIQSGVNVAIILSIISMGLVFSVYSVVWAVLIGMGLCGTYLMIQNSLTLHHLSSPFVRLNIIEVDVS